MPQIKDYCVLNDIHHIPVVLENDLSVLVNRFLGRYENGIDKDSLEYVKDRIKGLIEKEADWPDLVREFGIVPCQTTYDESNGTLVVNAIGTLSKGLLSSPLGLRG